MMATLTGVGLQAVWLHAHPVKSQVRVWSSARKCSACKTCWTMTSWQLRRRVHRAAFLATALTGTSELLLGVSTAANLMAGTSEGGSCNTVESSQCLGMSDQLCCKCEFHQLHLVSALKLVSRPEHLNDCMHVASFGKFYALI